MNVFLLIWAVLSTLVAWFSIWAARKNGTARDELQVKIGQIPTAMLEPVPTTKLPARALVIGHITKYRTVRVAVDSDPAYEHGIIRFTARPVDIVASPYLAEINADNLMDVEL